MYPLSGSQGPGGIDEHRGIMLAADLVNQDGGIDGRSIHVESVDTPGADAAAAAVDQLRDAGIDLVLGSYGSTISGPASAEAASNGMLFWETGAVGMLPAGADRGGLTFRVPPTGAVLGKAAIAFIADQVAPDRHRDPAGLRYAVSFVDDVYGRSVAAGAEHELRARGLQDVGSFGYDFRTVDMEKLVRRIAAAKPDVLFVSAYLEDAIALRRQLVAQHVKLFANIGTSSSYCMPAFGATLGEDAVGVYASDKPSASTINPAGLRPDARALLAARERRLRRGVGRGHEPRRARRLLGGMGVLHRRPAGGGVPGARRRRRGGPGDRPAAREPAERERPALRRSRHTGRRRQPRRRQRHLGMGGARRSRRDLAAGLRDPAHGSERVGRVVSRRTTIVVGVLCVTAYAGLAALSGHLSPLARGPLLDGIGPPQDYRWVNPPPDLAANNQPPSSGVFPIALDPNGSRPATPVTSDNQVTVIVPQGAFAKKAGQIEVSLKIEPVDPATLGSPGAGVTIFGNAYRLEATYQPSGDPAKLVLPVDAVLIYPVTPNLHAAVHQLYTSPDGQTWTAQQGSDSIAQQQAEGPVPELGYVVVAGETSASPVSPSGGSGGSSNTAIILIVLAACVGLVGLGLIVRGRK